MAGRRQWGLAFGLTAALVASNGPVRGAEGREVNPEINRAQNIGYLRSPDGGASFATALDDQGLGVGITAVDASGGKVHVLYGDTNEYEAEDYPSPVGGMGLHYRRSDDGGTAFGPSVRLDDDGGDSTEGDIVADGNTVVAAWEEHRIGEEHEDVLLVRSQDGGASFSAPEDMTATPAVQEKDAVLAADGALVALAYEGQDEQIDTSGAADPTPTDGNDIFVRVSGDGGTSFSSPVNLTFTGVADFGPTADEQRHSEPGVGVFGDTIVVAFKLRPPDPDTNPKSGAEVPARTGMVISTDRGASFGGIVVLPSGVDVSTAPAVLARDGLVHVVACHEPDPAAEGDTGSLLYWRSTDGGGSFGGPSVLHTSAESCNKPSIDGVGSTVHVAFEQDVAGTTDVFLLSSGDAGAGFGTARNVTSNPASSKDPSVAVDPAGGTLHVTWSDETSFLFSLEQAQDLPLRTGVRTVDPDDVVRFVAGAYEIFFDGGDVGLAGLTIDALATLPPSEPGGRPRLVLSLTEPAAIPGAGDVDDSDLVIFDPTDLGDATQGTFALYLDGSDLGLEDDGEDVDAVEVAGADVYLSTAGAFSLTGGRSGEQSDLVVCKDATTGTDSACRSTAIAFAGAGAGLAGGPEDVDGLALGPGGNAGGEDVLFSTVGDYDTGTAAGGGSDLLSCAIPKRDKDVPATRDGTLSDCGSARAPLAASFSAAAHGLASNIGALDFEY